MTRILTRRELEPLMTIADCIPAVEEAFGGTIDAATSGMHAANGTFHVKMAIGERFAVKINANFPDNPRRHGLPTIQGVVVLYDLERGTPLAILDSAFITALRTAAATAVAAKHLARRDAATATIVGCGTQGRAALEALLHVRPLTRVFAIDPAASLSHASVEVIAQASIDDAVAASDIVVTCTPSRTAILDERHLHPGLFIAATGADNPQKQELAPALMRATRVVADVLEQAATMGDLHHAIAAGAMTREDVHGELADVIRGRIAARVSDDEVFVFDSTGTALQDVAVATLALRRAEEREVGIEVAFG